MPHSRSASFQDTGLLSNYKLVRLNLSLPLQVRQN
jgi:hypothetical protein